MTVFTKILSVFNIDKKCFLSTKQAFYNDLCNIKE